MKTVFVNRHHPLLHDGKTIAVGDEVPKEVIEGPNGRHLLNLNWVEEVPANSPELTKNKRTRKQPRPRRGSTTARKRRAATKGKEVKQTNDGEEKHEVKHEERVEA